MRAKSSEHGKNFGMIRDGSLAVALGVGKYDREFFTSITLLYCAAKEPKRGS